MFSWVFSISTAFSDWHMRVLVSAYGILSIGREPRSVGYLVEELDARRPSEGCPNSRV
jgi:hypothetical protein